MRTNASRQMKMLAALVGVCALFAFGCDGPVCIDDDGNSHLPGDRIAVACNECVCDAFYDWVCTTRECVEPTDAGPP